MWLNRPVSCLPIAANWNPNLTAHCVDEIKLFTVALATDVVTDGEWALADISLAVT